MLEKDFQLYYTTNFNICLKTDCKIIQGSDFDDAMNKEFGDKYEYREVTKDDFYDVVLKHGKELRFYRFRFG